MKSYEVYICRRVALRWSKETVAEKAGILVDYVRYFEDGKKIGRDFESKIKFAIDEGFRELEPVEHYKARMLELAYEIKFETDVQQTLQRTSHLMVEIGKLQRELIG